MKSWPAYVVVAAVVVAVAAQIVALRMGGRTSDAAELAELRRSVEALGAEIRKLRADVDNLERVLDIVIRASSTREEGYALKVDVPEADEIGIGQEGGSTVTVTARADGTYEVDGKSYGADEIEDVLETLVAGSEGVWLIIHADSSIGYNQIVPLLSACSKRGIPNVALAVGSEETESGETEQRQVPEEIQSANVEPVDIVLEVDEAGGCTLDGRVVEWEELDGELKRVLRANPAMQLVVRAASAHQSEVKAVLEKAQKAGIYRVSLITGSKKETSGGAE